MGDEVVVLITAPTAEEGANIAQHLVDEHLIACANMVSGIRSFFFWEGKTQDASESLLICKTRQQVLDKVIQRVKELHSYTVPEIIALPIVAGATDYLAWLGEATKTPEGGDARSST